MATASSADDFFSPSQVYVSGKIPDDAVLGIYKIVGGIRKQPLDVKDNKTVSEFYQSLRGGKYTMPAKLPVRGMLIATWLRSAWRLAYVTGDTFIGSSGNEVCNVLIFEWNEKDTVRVREAKLLSAQFLNLVPQYLQEEKENRKIIRTREDSSSDEEIVDFMTLIPRDYIVPNDYKYPQEQLLAPKANTSANKILSAAALALMITYVKSPTEFIFTLKRHEKARQDMNTKMSQIYSTFVTDPFFIPSVLVVEKLAVVAATSGDGNWTRAYVTEIIDDDICVIQPVDGAGPMQVCKSNLRFVHRDLASIPQFGYKGKLTCVAPSYQRAWPDSATNAFSDLACVDMRFIPGLFDYFTKDGTAALYLYHEDKRGGGIHNRSVLERPGVWIGDELVQRGLARRVEAPPPDRQTSQATSDKSEESRTLAQTLEAATKIRDGVADSSGNAGAGPSEEPGPSKANYNQTVPNTTVGRGRGRPLAPNIRQ